MDEFQHVCDVPDCGKTFATAHGVTMHKNRAHYEGPPRARAARKSDHTPDELFEMVGAATEALFPGGIPTSRIIEIAELQKAMLKVVAR
jgi:hypothetical protein